MISMFGLTRLIWFYKNYEILKNTSLAEQNRRAGLLVRVISPRGQRQHGKTAGTNGPPAVPLCQTAEFITRPVFLPLVTQCGHRPPLALALSHL